ncbi:polyhydroxyalkanoic acid system family protein [Corallincola platygyrae]|uniref:Polyhydroxyalkanoic acid system family protein n=1 Tax=Corallincola platygyrae TaxID=1193278 RepID=A0ABW4XIY9_9GAMM
MATILVVRSHELGHEKIRELSEQIAGKLAEKYGIEWAWREEHLVFRHDGGADGHLKPTATDLEISIKLGFMLSMFRGSIEDSINEQLDKLLG